MAKEFTKAELEAYLDEGLAPTEMAEIENRLRTDPELAKQLSAINGRRDAGVHSLGEIWRRARVSCQSREQLGSYLLGILDDEEREYTDFHIGVVGCRYCDANLKDLRTLAEANEELTSTISNRRLRYFQSSAGYLQRDDS